MNLFEVGFENWYTLSIKMNLIVIGLFIAVVVLMKRKIWDKKGTSIDIDECELGIGNSKIKIKPNDKDREIAYKLWVELCTRKIGIRFEEDKDVITEVYNSWYTFFGIARDLIKELPPSHINKNSELIDLTEKVLNIGLRPHLTTYQAKFRKWYEKENQKSEEAPQEIQKKYSDYTELVADLLQTNDRMIAYKEILRKIAFKEK